MLQKKSAGGVLNLLTPKSDHSKSIKYGSVANRQLNFNQTKSRTAATSETMYSVADDCRRTSGRFINSGIGS
jgi:hypothetical protein